VSDVTLGPPLVQQVEFFFGIVLFSLEGTGVVLDGGSFNCLFEINGNKYTDQPVSGLGFVYGHGIYDKVSYPHP
jgi:hypothetical protein